MREATSHRGMAIAAFLLGASLIAGCQQEGPAERASKAIDEAAGQTGDYFEVQRDQASQLMENSSNRLQDCMETEAEC